MLGNFLKASTVVRKDSFVAFFLLFNVFAWHFVTPNLLNSITSGFSITPTESLFVWIAYYVGIIGSMLFGSILSNKSRRFHFLILWIILGSFTSLLPAIIGNFTASSALVTSAFIGISFGLGLPSCLGYFADCTSVENRGRTSGITLLITYLSAPILVILFGEFNMTMNSIILSCWRVSGLMVFFLKPEEKVVTIHRTSTSFGPIIRSKSFGLYFLAWLMYMFIDRFENPILNNFFGDFSYLTIGPIIGAFFVLIAGLLCDRIGRKRVIIYGFVVLGTAYALIGILPAQLFSWYFFLTSESTASGMLTVVFILVIWGDIAQPGTRDKYYAIGEIPYFLTRIIQLLAAPFVMLIPTSSAFSVASLFLFLAVLPLLYAPDTLPQTKIELRQLREYVDAAKKANERYPVGEVKN